MRSNGPQPVRTNWTRRQLLQGIGSAAALNSLPAIALSSTTRSGSAGRPKFAYVGSSAYSEEGNGSIHVFAIAGKRWLPIQRVPSAHPSSLVLHRNGASLYAANEVETHHGLPCGAVEAYSINADDGRLTKLNQQPLSLSATRPKSLAVSPDGRHLVAAVYGGGAYNALPIAKDGSLLRVSGMIKETGSGPHPEHQAAAHPHTVLFDTAGRHLLSTDTGSDRINVFSLADGGFHPVSRNSVQPGSAPGEMVVHPSGHLIFVANRLHASISSFRYDTSNGSFAGRAHTSSLPKHGTIESSWSLAVHPSGQFLYTASSSSLNAWRINTLTGELTLMQSTQQPLASPLQMTLSPRGDSLFLLDEAGHGAFRGAVDQRSGQLGRLTQVAEVAKARSLAIQYSEG